MKFVVKSLTDEQAKCTLMAYNGLKERTAMLNFAGMEKTETLKLQLIKRLLNKRFDLQFKAINSLREWVVYQRHQDELTRLETERKDQMKRKYTNGVRILIETHNSLKEYSMSKKLVVYNFGNVKNSNFTSMVATADGKS